MSAHPQTYVPAATLAPIHRDTPAPKKDAPTTPNFINDVAGGRVELPTIPRVLQKLITALRDPNVDAREISKALGQDPVLSAKVLRLANSSFFGGQRSMASIDAAVSLIGTAALNRLIVACGVAQSFKPIPGIDLPVFWRDALVAATASNRLAGKFGADAESAYVCGLLHGTGSLILCQTYPEIAHAFFDGFAALTGAELAQVEIECFGIGHPEVAALWVETLGFPAEVPSAIKKATDAPAATDVPLDLALRTGCSLAVSVAAKLDADAAFAALPAELRAKMAGPNGQPDKAYYKTYEALEETQPAL